VELTCWYYNTASRDTRISVELLPTLIVIILITVTVIMFCILFVLFVLYVFTLYLYSRVHFAIDL
jgi:hypothetical protein